MSIPTTGEEYTKLIEHLAKAAESAYMIGHLISMQDSQAPGDQVHAQGWLAIGQMLERNKEIITKLAAKRFQ